MMKNWKISSHLLAGDDVGVARTNELTANEDIYSAAALTSAASVAHADFMAACAAFDAAASRKYANVCLLIYFLKPLSLD
jgi:hypothetical protein